MTTVTLATDAGSGKAHKNRGERKGTAARAEEQGDRCPSPTWAPETSTDPPCQGKDHLPFLRPRQQQERQRIPAEEQPFTVESSSSSSSGDLPSWWGGKARVATRRPSSPFQSGEEEAFQQQEEEQSGSWSESSAAPAGGGGFAYSSGGQMMAGKAGYMPFDSEDRLEIFGSSGKRGGGFDQQAGPAEDDWRGGGHHQQQQQHSPAESGVSTAPAGLDAWPSAYASEMGEPWARQPEGAGQQGLRQVCGHRRYCVWCSLGPCFGLVIMASFFCTEEGDPTFFHERIHKPRLFFWPSSFACWCVFLFASHGGGVFFVVTARGSIPPLSPSLRARAPSLASVCCCYLLVPCWMPDLARIHVCRLSWAGGRTR